MSVIRLNTDDLDLLLSSTNLGDGARAIAREVFVLGHTHTEVAKRNKVARQRVTAIVATIRRTQEHYAVSSSDNIATVQLTLPLALATELQKLCDDMACCGSHERRRATFNKITRSVVAARLTYIHEEKKNAP
ncbi:hypothetical protein ACO0LB_17695 [Undibacterium sp. SXout7W]|uniref:hypothetical protein n=1 Tax=Undibacterium sp. SXout7W TaxID=3413049 RepID=UPI003BF16338